MIRFFFSNLILLGTVFCAQAQFSKKFAAYVGYAVINEPNVTLEYRFHPRLAASLEGAAFIPFVKEQFTGDFFTFIKNRVNGQGGAIRVGIFVSGKRHFGVMHRVMFDLTYFSSNLYKERFGVESVQSDRFYRQFMQYAVFYEPTFRLARDKRHHLFIRMGIGARGIWTRTVGKIQDRWEFRMAVAPVISLGYRIRLHPQRGYFMRDP